MKARLAHLTGGRAGQSALIWKSCAMLGRSSQADVRFGPDGDRMVAGRHASLAWHDGVWSVRDLGSGNGTFVDGARIHGETALRDGSIIQLGRDGPQVRFSVVWEAGAPEPVRTVDVDAMDDPDAFRTVPHTPVILSRPDRDVPAPPPTRGGIRRPVVTLVLVAAVLGGITLATAGPDSSPEAMREVLLHRADSVFAALAAIAPANAVMLSAIAETQSRVAGTRARLRRAPDDPVALGRLRDTLEALAERQRRIARVAALDVPGVERGGAAAIGVVEGRTADGRQVRAAAFAVRGADGRVRFVTGDPEIAALPTGSAALRVLLRDDTAGIPMRLVARQERRQISVLAPLEAHRGEAAAGRRAPFPAPGEPVLVVEATPEADRTGAVHTQSAATAVVNVEPGVARLERLAADAAAGSAVLDRHGTVVGLLLPEAEGYGVRAVPVTDLVDPSGRRTGD